ncbi:MAG: hemolysin family protein [Nitrospirota bacterium]|jgi:CBS domain containing-hemolysin-like protein
MTLLALSIFIVLFVSSLCSLTEAGFLSVRMPYVRALQDRGSRAGATLVEFKRNMGRPIAAILIINTAAHTAGAAVAGAQARTLFGEETLLWFSLWFTLAVLFISEIVPKVIGVAYSRPIARALALPWRFLITLLFPLIWLTEQLSRWLEPRERTVAASEEEVKYFAKLSAEEGSILPYEAELVHNVLHLDRVTVRDIMTPRPVVAKLPSDMSLRDAATQVRETAFSRLPVYAADDPETWVGVVLARDVLTALADDRSDTRLEELCTPPSFVSETTPGHVLLKAFLKRRTHLLGVFDEYGDITGIVTLEDVLEAVIGEEIVDEFDLAVDMQEVARNRRREQFGKPSGKRASGSKEDPP